MNDLINTVLGIINLLICIALIDKLIELFKNIKKSAALSTKLSGLFKAY